MAEQKIMSRVMKLLEVANDPNATDAERELAAANAERLMQKHMIDRMDLTPEEKGKIIKDYWDINIGEAAKDCSEEYGEWAGQILGLAENVLRHCSVKIHPRIEYVKEKQFSKLYGGMREVTNFSMRRLTIIGYPEDIAYAEKIWFRVFKEFVMNINPSWDNSLSLGENCYYMLKAGFKWGAIWDMAYKAQASLPAGGYRSAKGSLVVIPDPKTTKYCTALKTSVKQYLAAQGKDYEAHTQRHGVYRASFAQSYNSTIRQRLSAMRREAKEASSESLGVDADKFALAVLDTEESVNAEFYRLFPEYDPEVRRKMREAEAFQALADFLAMTEEEQKYVVWITEKENAEAEARWQKQSARARRNYGATRTRTVAADPDAWARGQQAASRVNLRNDGEVHKPNTKSIR